METIIVGILFFIVSLASITVGYKLAEKRMEGFTAHILNEIHGDRDIMQELRLQSCTRKCKDRRTADMLTEITLLGIANKALEIENKGEVEDPDPIPSLCDKCDFADTCEDAAGDIVNCDGKQETKPDKIIDGLCSLCAKVRDCEKKLPTTCKCDEFEAKG